MSDDSIDAKNWETVEEAAELIAEGKHQLALEKLRLVLKDHPHNPYAYHHIGAALAHLRHLEPARDAFKAAVRLAPNYLAARVALSHALRMLGLFDGALAQAKEARRRFPDSAEAGHAARLALDARKGDSGEAGMAEDALEPAANDQFPGPSIVSSTQDGDVATLDEEQEAPAEPDWEGLRALTGERDTDD